MLDNSYIKRDGCHNCKKVFVLREFESSDVLYCTYNAPPRPLSGSVALRELSPTFHEANEAQEKFDEWSEGREVEPYGYCSHFDPMVDNIEHGNLDVYGCKWILIRLEMLREDTISYPVDTTYEGWMEELQQMIVALKLFISHKEDGKVLNENEEVLVNSGFKTFALRILDLWR